MYAVFDEGGHQHAVQLGDVIEVDLRAGLEKGNDVSFDRVLLVRDGDDLKLGAPTVEGATVEGEVVDPLVKGKKLLVQKFRRRKADSKKARGHRQKYTRVRITKIAGKELSGSPS